MEEDFKRAGAPGALRVARDGEEAVQYLLGLPPFTDRDRFPPPSLVLLDLKLPRKSGFEVLEWRRLRPGMHVPVVVLTSSHSNADVTKAYELGANSYLVKPVNTGARREMIQAILAYWAVFNKVPETPNSPD